MKLGSCTRAERPHLAATQFVSTDPRQRRVLRIALHKHERVIWEIYMASLLITICMRITVLLLRVLQGDQLGHIQQLQSEICDRSMRK